jgi:drug/metabolite transporter (DMT)-like permease
VGAFGGKYLLGERVTAARWAGVLLVCLGVMLVCIG